MDDSSGRADGAKRERLHYLDAIRVIMLLLGIPFHASEAFRSGKPWIIFSLTESPILAVTALTIYSFRMFAFFLTSGYFSTLILDRKPSGTWLPARTIRLTIPLIVATLMLAPIELAVLARHRAAINATDFNVVYGRLLTSDPGNWIAHRWFLVTLVLYSLAIAVLMLPPIRSIPSKWLRIVDATIDRQWALWTVLPIALALWGVVDAAPFRFVGRSWAGGTIPIDRVLLMPHPSSLAASWG